MIDVATISSIAFRAIKANKMRSILTSLGIIIGVAAVIVMLAIGNGAQISIQNEMKTMGANLIIVRSGVATSSGARSGHGSRPSMRKSDGDAENSTGGSDTGRNCPIGIWQCQLVNRGYGNRQPVF